MAVSYASKVYPTFFATLESNKKDDVADAILMALYWIEKHHFKVKPRQPKKKRKIACKSKRK
jgi:hypothetical protein